MNQDILNLVIEVARKIQQMYGWTFFFSCLTNDSPLVEFRIKHRILQIEVRKIIDPFKLCIEQNAAIIVNQMMSKLDHEMNEFTKKEK